MLCTKSRSLENKGGMKSIIFKDEIDIIGKKHGGAKNDRGITIIPKYNLYCNDSEWYVFSKCFMF